MSWDGRQRWPRKQNCYFPGSLASGETENHLIVGNLTETMDNGYTISFWIKPHSYSSVTEIPIVGTVSQGAGTPHTRISFNSIGEVVYRVTNSAGALPAVAPATNTIDLNVWTKVTIAASAGDNTITIFQNGESVFDTTPADLVAPPHVTESWLFNERGVLNAEVAELAIYDECHDVNRVVRDMYYPNRVSSSNGDNPPIYLWDLARVPPGDLGRTSQHTNFYPELIGKQSGVDATMVGSSVAVGSSSPFYPVYNVSLLDGKKVQQSSGYATSPDDLDLTNYTSAIYIDRQIGGPFRPLAASVCELVINDYNGSFVTGTHTMFTAGNKGLVKATYAGSEHVMFAGFIHSQKDTRQKSKITKNLTLHDNYGALRRNTWLAPPAGTDPPNVADIRGFIGKVFSLHTPKLDIEIQCNTLVTWTTELDWIPNIPLNQVVDEIAGIDIAWYWMGDSNNSKPDWHKAAINVTPFSEATLGTAVTTISEYLSIDFYESNEYLCNYLEYEQTTYYYNEVGSGGQLNDSVFVPANTTKQIPVVLYDPDFLESHVPAITHGGIVSGTTWDTNTASDGGGSDMKANTTVTSVWRQDTVLWFDVTNTHASTDLWVTQLDVRSPSLAQVYANDYITIQNTTSQSSYGIFQKTISNRYLTNPSYNASNMAFLMSVYDEPIPVVRATIRNNFYGIFAAELGNHIAMVDTLLGVAGRFFVTNVTHEIRPNKGLEHTTTIVGEKYI